MGISDLILRRILHYDLNFHPYKMNMSERLSPADYANRQTLCVLMLARIPLDTVFFNADDEDVNKQNSRYWAQHNPRLLTNAHYNPLNLLCCRVLSHNNGGIGPYFFEEEGVTLTTNCERYVTE